MCIFLVFQRLDAIFVVLCKNIHQAKKVEPYPEKGVIQFCFLIHLLPLRVTALKMIISENVAFAAKLNTYIFYFA